MGVHTLPLSSHKCLTTLYDFSDLPGLKGVSVDCVGPGEVDWEFFAETFYLLEPSFLTFVSRNCKIHYHEGLHY